MDVDLDVWEKQGGCWKHITCLIFNFFWLRKLWHTQTGNGTWTSYTVALSVVFLMLTNRKMQKKMENVFILLLCCHAVFPGKIIFQVFFIKFSLTYSSLNCKRLWLLVSLWAVAISFSYSQVQRKDKKPLTCQIIFEGLYR